GSIICDPTWKASPYGRRPSETASRARLGTCPDGIPNLPWSPTVPPAPLADDGASRSSTAAPGACPAILCSSVSLSAANHHTPARQALAMSAAGLTGLVYSTVSGWAPAITGD